MVRKDLYRKHIEAGHGAHVSVHLSAAAAAAVHVGRWLVERGRFFVDLSDVPESVTAGSAQVEVELPTGVHRFQAWLRPGLAGRYEVFPGDAIDVEQRREAVRRPLDLPLRFGPPGGQRPLEAVACDLSRTGIGFQCAYPLDVGTRLDLHFLQAPAAALGVLRVEVVRRHAESSGWSYGGRFLGLASASHARLIALLAQMGRDAAPEPTPVPAADAESAGAAEESAAEP